MRRKDGCCNHRSAADSSTAMYDDAFALSVELAQAIDEADRRLAVPWSLAVCYRKREEAKAGGITQSRFFRELKLDLLIRSEQRNDDVDLLIA